MADEYINRAKFCEYLRTRKAESADDYGRGWKNGIIATEKAARGFPAADVVSIEVLKKWLYENALNNAGSSYGFACVEISKRLDGLRRYANECREENK